MNRRDALVAGSALALAGRLLPHLPLRPAQQPVPLAPDVVRDFVRAAHVDAAAVRAALDARPSLANACWDWGGGDFETALGAASHMGRRDIAELLVGGGARPDTFTLVVLRDLDLLRAQLQRRPSLVQVKGPHGLTLEAHAKATSDADVMRQVAEMVAEARAALR